MTPETAAQARVLFQRDSDGVGWVTLNRPGVHNALDYELLGQLAATIGAEGEQSRALVLQGAGERAFSTGFDLGQLTGTTADLEADRAIGRAADAIRDSPVPVLAAMRGYCQGAAVELALTCDLRLAASDLQLRVPAVQLGVVYRPRLVARMAELAGLGRAADLLLIGALIGAEAAFTAGLLSEVVAGELLQSRAAELAHALAAAPAAAVRGTKAVLRQLGADPLSPGPRAELEEWRSRAAGSPERREALDAARARLTGGGSIAEDPGG